MNYGADFAVNPKKFYCKEHRNYEIEYQSSITQNFYCKKCKPDQIPHPKDKVLSNIVEEVQDKFSELKLQYSKKKETLIQKLNDH